MKTSLLLMTHEYPLTRGDASFIKYEMPYVARQFEKVYILCMKDISQEHDTLPIPDNAVLYCMPSYKNTLLRKIKKLPGFCSFGFQRILFQEIGYLKKARKKLSFVLLRTAASFLSEALLYYKKLNKIYTEHPDIRLFYSYWFTFDTMAALLLKENFKHTDAIPVSVCTRTHGYDLYEFRSSLEYQPFKRWMDKRIDAVFFISRHGIDYYVNTFVVLPGMEKYHLAYLGTENNYSINNYRPDGIFTMVSCSAVIPVKRVDLIVHALVLIQGVRLHWIHIGDGMEFTKMMATAREALSGNSSVSYEFRGFMPNEVVLEFYHHNYIDCFVSSSESEGLPISMMEAMSFGIPVIATNVGGVPEIVNEKTGVLLHADVSAGALSQAIVDFYSLDADEKNKMRRNARLLWEEHFNAAKNLPEFADALRRIADFSRKKITKF